MTTHSPTPYSGSLLRLAFTTTAVLAVLALAVSLWQGALANALRSPAGASTTVNPQPR